MPPIAQPAGNYRFLAGPASLPFCAGVAADPGFEIVRAVLRRPVPYRRAFDLIDAHLAAAGRPVAALCALELRCARPYTRETFGAFNADYAERLRQRGLFIDGRGSTARTNVAPAAHPPAEQSIYAFAYTVPSADAATTFVLSGAPEAAAVRPGETSAEAMRAKSADVLATLGQRLAELGAGWDDATAIGAYAVHDLGPAIQLDVSSIVGPASVHGVVWYHAFPPVDDMALEWDARGVRRESVLDAQ